MSGSVPSSRRWRAALALTAALCAAGSASAQPPAVPAATASDAPAASGAGDVGLLALSVTEVATQERLMRVLASSDPNARAVAARIAVATRSFAQLPALVRSLPSESDGLAGAEMVRALLILQGAPADTAVLPHVTRLGPVAARVYAETLIRVRPDAFLAALPDLARLDGFGPDLGELTRFAMNRHQDRAAEIGARLVASAPAASVRALLQEPLRKSVPDAVLTVGLQSASAEIRDLIVWAIVMPLLRNDPLRPGAAVIAAAQAAPSKPLADAEQTWELFGRELIARTEGGSRSGTDWTALLRRDRNRVREIAGRSRDDVFTKAERAALDEALTEEMRALRRIPGVPEAISMLSSAAMSAAVTLHWVTPGLAADLFRAAGCDTGASTQPILGAVAYRPEGTVARGSLDPSSLEGRPAGCRLAAQAALVLSVSPLREGRPDGETIAVLIPTDSASASCLSDWPADRGRLSVVRPGGDSGVSAPKKIVNVNPIYPRAAQNARIQGVVVLEATITPSGCIADVEVIRSIPPLDFSAMMTVLQWRYTPTLIEGRAVPLSMTLIINFTLQ
jgi:TonB family protein